MGTQDHFITALRCALGLLAALALGLGCAQAKDLRVGPGGQYLTLADAVRASVANDRIIIAPGRYVAKDLRIPHDLTLNGSGVGQTVLFADGNVAKGLLVTTPGVSLIVTDMTLTGARSPDRNGAGIRHQGRDLGLIRVKMEANENGVLATGDANGALVVRNAWFEANGHGDGYSHGIYQSSGAQFDVRDSVFDATKVGHHLKTLAGDVNVVGNVFDDRTGETSYVLDVTAGGDIVMTDNDIYRRRSARQNALVHYSTARGGRPGRIVLARNRVVTEKRAVYLLSDEAMANVAERENEIIKGSALLPPRGAATVPSEGPAPRPSQGLSLNTSRGATAGTEPVPSPAPVPPEEREPAQANLAPALPSTYAAQADPAPVTSAPQGQALPPARIEPPARTASPARREPSAALQKGIVTQDGYRLLPPPQFPQAPTGTLARFGIRRMGEGHGWVTFGQVFVQGRYFARTPLVAEVAGQLIPTQIDVKATHPDGSVRHAAVTIHIPPQTEDTLGGLLRPLRPGETPPPPPRQRGLRSPFSTPVLVTVRGGQIPLRRLSIAAPIGPGGSAETWLSGPLVTERSTRFQIGSVLGLTADYRRHVDGVERLQLTFENHASFAAAPRLLSYRASVSKGAEILLNETVSDHYHNAGLTLEVPIGAGPAFDVIHDPSLLLTTAAIPPYDLAQTLRADSVSFPREEVRPGIEGPITTYMPTTGGRPDLGLLPDWSAAWAISQHALAKDAMLYAARIGQTIPWHYDEDGTGLPVRADRRPLFWAEARGAKADAGNDRMPDIAFTGGQGPWTPDLAHKPELAYPAYLATAEASFARALGDEAAYAINGVWPEKRGAGGTLVINHLQLRAAAWSLRTIGNAAFILPDDDPLKDYFVAVRDENLAALRGQTTPLATAGATAGDFTLGAVPENGAIAPWQHDFMGLVLAVEAKRGSAAADAALRVYAPFAISRAIVGGAENPSVIAGNRMKVLTDDGRRLTDWPSVMSATRGAFPARINTSAADSPFGILVATLAAIDWAAPDLNAERALQELAAAEGVGNADAIRNNLGRPNRPAFALGDFPPE